MKDSARKAMFAKGKSFTQQDVVDKLNSHLSNDYYPKNTNHIREFENLGGGKVRFRYSGGTIDSEMKRTFKASGFKISNINNVLDAGHLDAEGKL
jgi:hypothetical protein